MDFNLFAQKEGVKQQTRRHPDSFCSAFNTKARGSAIRYRLSRDEFTTGKDEGFRAARHSKGQTITFEYSLLPDDCGRLPSVPRKIRVEYAGAIYHVMNRGDRREPIFKDDLDRRCFLHTLAEACAKTSWQADACGKHGENA
jgi:hypothetical protein